MNSGRAAKCGKMACLSGGDHIVSSAMKKSVCHSPPVLSAENVCLRLLLGALCAVFLGPLASVSARGQIFVGQGSSKVSEYTTSGAIVNASLVLGISSVNPLGLAADGAGQLFVSWAHFPPFENTVGSYTFSGAPINPSLITVPYSTSVTSLALDGQGHIYVADIASGTVGEYTTSGGVINASLISGLQSPGALAFDGLGNLYIALNVGGVTSGIGKYTTSGNVVNASLIAGLYDPAGLAVDNQGHLFVSLEDNGVVSEYTTSGSTLNASLIQGLNLPSGLALDGQGNLFVVNQGAGSICEYTTSGAVVNASLITGLHGLYSIAVAVPEPSATVLALAGAAVIIARRRGIRVS